MAKLGLALGGGVARGLAHIGVLKVLESLRIKPDLIAGTSMGAVIGATYARGMSAGEIEGAALSLNWGRRAWLMDITVPRTGLIRGQRIKRFLEETIGDVHFADLSIPFACTATDLMTGDEVVLQDGPVVDAVRASISIPAIFTPAILDEKILVDGGLRTPIPVRLLRRMGADFIIAVNVLPSATQHSHIHLKKGRIRVPNIFDVMMHTSHILSHQRVKTNLRGAKVIIEPDLADIAFGDFHRARECIARGEEAARLALEGTELARTGRPGS